ncbi:hypothetical protein K438DRAFT_1953668 [Mycena galopus ATCC 62051]|nr:hypothetical protein K438DRAFT_1953668 [Mycena galopus ATCC 62051]
MSSPPIFGWTPSSPEGDVVDVPPQASCQFTFQLEGTRDNAYAHSAEVPSSPPTVGFITPSSHETEKIPRPPNSFIIFRTEFTRLYCVPRRGKPRRDVNRAASPGPTLSRMASEAWAALSAEEKRYYQNLAALAKKKHAQVYPNYQYRPQRRKVGSPRVPAAPKRRRPSPALTVSTVRDTHRTRSPSVEQPPPSPEIKFSPSAVDPAVAVKADRRRSSSVPVTSGEHLYTSSFLSEERWERPAQSKRRSRSVTQDWVRFASSPEPAFDPRSPQTAVFPPGLRPSLYAQIDTVNPAALFTPAQHMSPLAAVASSLAGWNGAVSCPGPPPPMAPQPIRFNQPSWLGSPETVLMYQPAASPDGVERASSLTPLAGNQWPLEPPGQYVFGAPADWDYKGTDDSEDYARTVALREYEHGLQERVHGMAYPHGDLNFSGFELDFDPAAELQF